MAAIEALIARGQPRVVVLAGNRVVPTKALQGLLG
jgi:hypothetical protein